MTNQSVDNPNANYVRRPQRVMYTVPEVAAILGIGRSTAYELILSGELPSVKLGSRRLISPSTLKSIIGEFPPLPDSGREPDSLGDVRAVGVVDGAPGSTNEPVGTLNPPAT